MFCPECGNQVEKSYKFCPDCGFKLAALIKSRENQGVTTHGDEPSVCAESQNQKEDGEHRKDVKENKNDTAQEKVQPASDDLQPVQGGDIPPEPLENRGSTTVPLFHHQVDIVSDAGSVTSNKIQIAESNETYKRLSDSACAVESNLHNYNEAAHGSDVSVTTASPPTTPTSEKFTRQQTEASFDASKEIGNNPSKTPRPTASEFSEQTAQEFHLVGTPSPPEQDEEKTICNATQSLSFSLGDNDNHFKTEMQKSEETERKSDRDDPSPSQDVTTHGDEPSVFAESQNQKEDGEHTKDNNTAASETFMEQQTEASLDASKEISNNASKFPSASASECSEQKAQEHNLVGKPSPPEQDEEKTICNVIQKKSLSPGHDDNRIETEVQKCEETERKGDQDDPLPSQDVTTHGDEPSVFAESQNQKEDGKHTKDVKDNNTAASETFMEQQTEALLDASKEISNNASKFPSATPSECSEQKAQEHNLVGKPSPPEQDKEKTICKVIRNMPLSPGHDDNRIKTIVQKCEETERKGDQDDPSPSQDVTMLGDETSVRAESQNQKEDQEHMKEEINHMQRYNDAAHGSDTTLPTATSPVPEELMECEDTESKGNQARGCSDKPNTNQPKSSARESSVDPCTGTQATEYPHLQQSGSRNAVIPQSSLNHSYQNRGQGVQANINPNQQYPQPQLSTNNDLIAVHFYVVTSKDLHFDPKEDEVHLKSEQLFGSWEHWQSMKVIKSLGDERFLFCCRILLHQDLLHYSIPYKYAVLKGQKIKYEAIYCKETYDNINRCLSFKQQLLTAKGEWHQYDDVLHLSLKRDWYLSKQRPVIKARDQAGLEMLKNIFDSLTTWNEDHVKNFFGCLEQFKHTFSNPVVHVGYKLAWGLQYSAEQVKNLLMRFLMDVWGTSERQSKISHLHVGILSLLICRQFLKTFNEDGFVSKLCTLLCLPDKTQDNFCSFWENFADALGDKNSVADAVETLCSTARQRNITEWVLVIPLIHLLRGAKPFEQLPLVLNPKAHLLTGLGGMEVKHSNDKRMVQVMKEHKYLVDIDNGLARSWMSLLNVDDLLTLIPYVSMELLDILHCIALNIKSHLYNHKPFEGVISHLVKRENHRDSRFDNTYGESCLKIAVQLLDCVCSCTTDPNCYGVPLALLDLVCLIAKRFNYTDSQSREKIFDESIASTLKAMTEWRRKTFTNKLLRGDTFSAPSEIEVWIKLLSSFSQEKHSSSWTDRVMKDFEWKLRQEQQEDQIGIYINQMEKLRNKCPQLCKSMEKCALEATAAICQEKSGKAVSNLFKRHDITKFGKLISVVVMESWPKDANGTCIDGEDLIFEYLLNWPMAKTVFQITGVRETLIDSITNEAQTLMTLAKSAFQAVTDKFLSGEIQMKNLDQILQREHEFVDLLKLDVLCDDYRCKDEGSMNNLMNQRKDEAKAVHKETEMVKSLLEFCQELPQNVKADFSGLDKKFHQNTQLMSLNKFRKVYTLDGQTSHTTEEDTYFNLHGNIRQMTSELHTIKDSSIFKMCWTNQVEQLSREQHDTDDTENLDGNEEVYTLDLVYSKIFQSCYRKYSKLHNDLQSGNLLLEEVDSIFDEYKGHYKDLEEEFLIMRRIDASDKGTWIQKRIYQMQQYHELDLAMDSAKIIMDIRNIICPQGNFDDMEKLQNMNQVEFKENRLNVIDDALIEVKNILEEITNERRQCLKELGDRSEFVQWVKAVLKGINELKVFVDLASISAGENDLEVDRVACFHDAVLGYSSILFGLPQDSNFYVFKESLAKLWKALENDPKIPQKLRDTARQLEWLKTVKDSHGSVEFSSLSLATSINERGIYIIKPQNHKKITLDSSLMLQLQNGPENKITCTYDDLKELQNKLMLMSGKREHNRSEVDHFAQVFDNVQRLAKVFVDLYAAGNPLFKSWEAEIYCKIQNSPSIIMEINFCKTHHIEIHGSLVEQLPALSKKMELFLDDWQKFIDKQRSDHYYLNYFTAEQIFYLCSVVTPVNENTEIEDKALTMLSFIRPNCTTSNVWSTWKKFHSQFEPGKMIDETVAFQSHFDYQEDHNESSFSASNFSPDNLVGNMDQIVGLRELEVLWNSYMKNEEICFHDILDIRSLGELLKMMTTTESQDENEWEEPVLSGTKDNSLRRSLPRGLYENVPNLIICPHDEILTSSICLYMSSEYDPLPSYDEVLLCTPTTSVEQVELFLRRCLTPGDLGKKIYSMLRADQLSYDVSSAMEKYFQKFCTLFKHEYRLVIFCSADKEHTYVPTAFSQFKRDFVPQEPLENIQKYLSSHYTVDPDYRNDVFKGGHSVGVVASTRAGLGKSLYIQRLYEKLERSVKQGTTFKKCIRLTECEIDDDMVLQSLYDTPKQNDLKMFHFDVTATVQKGLKEFLFKLLFLRYLMHSDGRLWQCTSKHLYVIELLQPSNDQCSDIPGSGRKESIAFLDIFPKVFCNPPKKVMELEENTDRESHDPLMDDECFRSEAYQRPYQYLSRFYIKENLDKFTYKGVEGSHGNCLQILLFYCGILDPSWAELRNFVWFLNMQLKDCENSDFCNFELVGDTLHGFKNFVVEFMILMSKDFATPSLCITDQSTEKQQMDISGLDEKDLAPFLIRKRWESAPHPYIFFNDDHISMTFIGFHLVPNTKKGVDAINPLTREMIKENIMTQKLYAELKHQGVPFNENFDQLPRDDKIAHLCKVLGVKKQTDPDQTYELTTDNILKILAIHMRFRCGIPVVLMGETGCGKTRLIKFMCELRRSGAPTENMKLVKVHGGTSTDMIYEKVKEAQTLARTNKENHECETVLFFDEANTTEAISSIKEIMCDNSVKGQQRCSQTGLQIIAACNPYRKHTEEMIKRLEASGLGYRIRAEETEDRLGSIPLRQLVYRVHVLPPSMITLVWDFGQLSERIEQMYIEQIVQRQAMAEMIGEKDIQMITRVLSLSQNFMREKKDECSFVSLRDVERCMHVLVWFHRNHSVFSKELRTFIQGTKKNPTSLKPASDRVIWSIIMATAVCYQACLEEKKPYWKTIGKELPKEYTIRRVQDEIQLMQNFLLNGVPMDKTIARNDALKENFFMMVISVELRIPLFIVGKPGSSKSLSKTLIADAMQGAASHSELFKRLKQVHLMSFQCSPHSTPEGIINTFKQCSRFQENKNLDEYISVVVLDEIGLAEDSPKMPLKTLHPLLEEGCIDDEPQAHKRVGFIGISNWALDPAKMNRGIFVSRGEPNRQELIKTASGICCSEKKILDKVKHLYLPFAKAYITVCEEAKDFFGLRDFYSLVKMVFSIAKIHSESPSTDQIAGAILRNFSGKDDIDVMGIFGKELRIDFANVSVTTLDLIHQSISQNCKVQESRYLLVLTKNYAALQILQQLFFIHRAHPEIIFGSSFPKDQEYTQICKNINRVKVCMETGQTVVLLNLQNLYESLYDALNQYYVTLGGLKYVDLGLGTHRVKCRVHDNFRLIVIEEKEVVYKRFPTPLINRLEKHYLDVDIVLKYEQKNIARQLKEWVDNFVTLRAQSSKEHVPSDVFIGYHSDTCSSVVFQVTEQGTSEADAQTILDKAKCILLNCATPDSVVRLEDSRLPDAERTFLINEYSKEQMHTSLGDYILFHTQQEDLSQFFTEVTTFSRLLTAMEMQQLHNVTNVDHVMLLSLYQFDTEYSFLKKIREFLGSTSAVKVLIIQADYDEHSHRRNIVSSAKFSCTNEINKWPNAENTKIFVYFVTRLPRIEGGTSHIGFQGGPWGSVHIDDLRRSREFESDVNCLKNQCISNLFEDPPIAMDVEQDTELTQNELSPVLENWVDTTDLIRSCVQSAVSMLRDGSGSRQFSTKTVESLLTLLNESETQGGFANILRKRLYLLLLAYESEIPNPKGWVLNEASNVNALQEGGTFLHTLWRKIQAVVTPLLANVVSVIDRDCNLDLLLRDDEEIKNLWLEIFANSQMLNLPYVKMENNSKVLMVQSHVTCGTTMHCAMPFSWWIKDFIDGLMMQTVRHEKQSYGHVFEVFSKTPFGSYMVENMNRKSRRECYERYLHDFVFMTLKVAADEEVQLMCQALANCVDEMRGQKRDEDELSLLHIHIAYHFYQSRLQNLSRMISLQPEIVSPLRKKRDIRDCPEMVLDVYAAIACIERLDICTLNTDELWQHWLKDVKSLQPSLELIMSPHKNKYYGQRCKERMHDIRKGWQRIYIISLFAEHMLLGLHNEEKQQRTLVLKHIQTLNNVLEGDADVKLMSGFQAVVTVLKSCKQGASDQYFRFGSQCRVCTRETQDPVELPCHHLFCLTCISDCLAAGQTSCPNCRQQLPNDFQPHVSENIRAAFRKYAEFSHHCDGFFIDLLSMVCFKDNTPPAKDVIMHLLSYLTVETEQQIHTNKLSPFDESPDEKPVVRSVILKLLLKFSFEDVKEYLQKHLSSVEESMFVNEEDKAELYALYINCLEDSLWEQIPQEGNMAMSQVYSGETQFLEKFLTETTSAPGVVSIQQLQDIAQLRLSLTLAAELISHTLSDNNGPDGAEDFLKMVRKLCEESGNDWYRVYLIRKLSEQWGAAFIQALVKRPHFRWLIPTEIHQQHEDDAQMDQYLVYGEDFKIVRDAVAKAVIDGDVDWIEEVCEKCTESPRKRTIYILLALFREITTLYRSESTGLHCTPELHQAFEDFISGSNYLTSREVRDFATALIHNKLGCLSIHPGLSVPESTVIELTVHLAAVLLTSTHPLLMPLNQLGLSPENMQMAFIPTMPDDMLAVAQAAIQQNSRHLAWYECPNKHPCCVDMCGLPMETTKCPECGEEIGGVDHKALPGFKRILPQGDRTRHGHILGDPAERNKPNTLDTKDMSLTPFILVRLVTHLAMLLGSSEKHQCIKKIIDPPVEDACLFLTKHIQKDIDQLNQALGKGADYCLTAIHMLLRSLLDQPVKTSLTIDPNLATKQSRNTWDTTMVADIMTPQLTILNQFLPQVRDGIRNDSRVSKNLIVMLVSGDECDFLRSLPGVSQIHSSAVWSCRKRLSLLSLTHVVQHTDKKEELPLLLRFLQKEKEFRQIKFLPDILTLQRVLVRQFQNTSDQIVGSIGEFIDKQSGKRAWYEKHINIFLKTWNLLRLPVTNNEVKIPEEFCSQDLDINSDLQYLLPQRQGPGLCATGLVSYLVTLHNELVKVVDSYTGEDSSSYKVSVVELSEQHVISYDLEKDLLPLVLSNCQYSLEQGHETISQYDLPRIQQQILIHFIQGKPLITRSGIPTLVNTQDRDYESTFKAIKGKVPQDPMPSLKRTGVSRLLGSYSDVCEALKIVELVLGFLSMTGGHPKMTLGTYLKDVLRITDTDQQILQALNRCTLNHCISLWQLLSFLRSENMLHLNREPFGSAAYSAYQQPLSEEERTELKGFVLRRMVDQWWFELHEFLLLNLGRPRFSDFYKPEWSVKMSVIAHMDRKAVEVPACVEEEFPENMHLSQIVEIWKCAAIARRDRMNNGS